MNPVRDQLNRGIHDLRISVMDTCNFRCGYCMPEDQFDESYQFLRPHQRLDFDRIVRLADAFSALGVRKLRLTGGEPLLRKNLPELIQRLDQLPAIDDIALTTNGLLLEAQLPALIQAGLKRVTVSLDALDDNLFRQLNGGRSGVEPILRGIQAALQQGIQLKINCVLQKGCNESEILPLIRYFRHSGAVLRFIEFMDVGNINDWRSDAVVSGADVLQIITGEFAHSPVQPNYQGEVAKRYRLSDGSLEFGLITSVSQPFCGDCGRARLSADGMLYTCLFAQTGHPLKPLLEDPQISDQQLREHISSLWQQRRDRYSELRHKGPHSSRSKIEMYVIGG